MRLSKSLSQKTSRIIGIMYRLKHIYPQAVLLTLYSALIVQHLTYCLLVWGSKIVPNRPFTTKEGFTYFCQSRLYITYGNYLQRI